MGKLEFDSEGRVKVPEIKKEPKRKILFSEKKIILKYCGVEQDKLIECEWEIKLPKEAKAKEVFEIKNWVDKVVDLHKPAWIYIKKINDSPLEYSLIIKGRGQDERCTWCQSFRTSLKTHFKKLGIELKEIGGCRFV